jgi:ADP-ribose pyrophosphatase
VNFKVIKENKIFEGRVFSVNVDEIEYNGTGNRASRQVAHHPGGSVVVPIKSDRKIILISQYRYPHRKSVIEFPAGKLEHAEDPLDCAKRELAEETGYTSNKISKLGKIFTTPGFCDEILHIYLAEDLIPGDHAREEGEEGMEMLELTIDEIEKKIQDEEIVDGKTICGIHFLRQRNQKA